VPSRINEKQFSEKNRTISLESLDIKTKYMERRLNFKTYWTLHGAFGDARNASLLPKQSYVVACLR
jgi:hypothetical protein